MVQKIYDGYLARDIRVFDYQVLQEIAGTHSDLTTSKSETDTPVAKFTVRGGLRMMEGVLQLIHIRLNWVNAVSLDALRIYAYAVAGDYESSMNKLWDSTETVTELVDDDEYIFEVEVPFYLGNIGTMYYAPEWSAACGNIQGYIRVKGVKMN